MATRCSSFRAEATLGAARAGVLRLPHGAVSTPAFMPVGTRAAVRGIAPEELRGAGVELVLANTYHLWERPGHGLIEELGGLHAFMAWDGPILTDSGGYQAFSLSERVTVDDAGVRFRSKLDGELRFLTPELAVEIQEAFGVDVAMVLDECVAFPATRTQAEVAVARTTAWLERSLRARTRPERTALFGIVQGSTFPDLRAAHAGTLAAMDLDGIALGGLSVGEGHEAMIAAVEACVPELPGGTVRYLMGVGHPGDIAEAVARGIDLFDCVLPTRMGRHGQAYTWEGRLNLKNAIFRRDPRPLDPATPDSPANAYSRAYLHHLLRSDDHLGRRLVALHNVHLYQQLVRELRAAITAGDADAFAAIRARAARASRPPPAVAADEGVQ
ncbi:MAG: tRNA guanosine(34) transglycosylase Tgt [Alphaproteobacteria bacterium]|nr:tRNA guanosine(34) transglycosylase Tgt [Alphaproteobacteria bacterium]